MSHTCNVKVFSHLRGMFPRVLNPLDSSQPLTHARSLACIYTFDNPPEKWGQHWGLWLWTGHRGKEEEGRGETQG